MWQWQFWQQANVKGDSTKAGPLTCGIERLYLWLQDYSFTLSISFYQWLFHSTLSQFIITITRVSQNMSQDTSCHNFRDDVPDFLSATRTGHQWMMAGLDTTRDSGPAASDDSSPGPGSVKTSATNNQSSARPERMRPTLLSPGVLVTYNDGTGPGLGLENVRQSPEYWSWCQRGRPWLTLDIIYCALHHWLYSCPRLKYAWNKLHGKLIYTFNFVKKKI